MQTTTYPFSEIPHEINQLIVSNLTHVELINLRLVNKNCRNGIDKSNDLKIYPRSISMSHMREAFRSVCVIHLLVIPIFLGLLELYKNGFGSSLLYEFGLISGIISTFSVIKLYNNSHRFLATQVKLERLFFAFPITAIILTTAGAYGLHTLNSSPLQGSVHLIHFLLIVTPLGIGLKEKNSFRSLLEAACFSRLNLSHVNPNKLDFIHLKSDKLFVIASTVSHLGLLLLVNPSLALIGSLLTATTAKAAYTYYQASKMQLHRM